VDIANAVPSGRAGGRSAELLRELRSAHDELLQAIAEMERVATQVESDSPAFNSARFRIGRASLARRMLWHKIFTHLSARVKDADVQTLDSLRDSDVTLLRHSSAHVGRWPPQAVMAEWHEYREAAKTMRQHMRESVEFERKHLYTLLSRYD
jgi:hypothetical protein